MFLFVRQLTPGKIHVFPALKFGAAMLMFTGWVLQAAAVLQAQQTRYSGVYAPFGRFITLPPTVDDAMAQGYTLRKDCASSVDEYGTIYSNERTGFLPGLMYNTHRQLSGMVFAVNTSQLFRPDEVRLACFASEKRIHTECGGSQETPKSHNLPQICPVSTTLVFPEILLAQNS